MTYLLPGLLKTAKRIIAPSEEKACSSTQTIGRESSIPMADVELGERASANRWVGGVVGYEFRSDATALALESTWWSLAEIGS
jgi:hypothetical protein